MWRFAPSAIHSTLASRRLLQLVDVLISSIVSTALTPSNKREKIKGLSLRDQAQPFVFFGKTQPQLAAAGRNDTMKYSGIGGQAVIEGIMMQNGDDYAIAVRKPDGEIEVKRDRYVSLTEKYPILGLPFIRGVFKFADSMVVGMRALTWSCSFLRMMRMLSRKV